MPVVLSVSDHIMEVSGSITYRSLEVQLGLEEEDRAGLRAESECQSVLEIQTHCYGDSTHFVYSTASR